MTPSELQLALCWFGFHRWNPWGESDWRWDAQRSCKDCGIIERTRNYPSNRVERRLP